MREKILSMVLFLLFSFFMGAEQKKLLFDRYHTPEEINEFMVAFSQNNPKTVKLHTLSRSAGGKEIYLLEIGSEISWAKKSMPAVLVVSNLEGTVPIASEAALFLCQMVISEANLYRDKSWYILVSGNPDAASRFFSKPIYLDARNNQPYNDDMDDQTDEDGVDDLDGNGVITQMRVKDPQGIWLPFPNEPRLMKRADWAKGEKGIYKLYSEGIDNDGDGEYNEDGPGGVNVGINFPHLFKAFQVDGGLWAGSEAESFSLIKFAFEHPEIALTFTFGHDNFCLNPPQGGRKTSVDLNQIKIPERFGRMFGVDIERTYTMAEIMDITKKYMPEGMEINESMISSFLGLGVMVNPLPDDLKFYQELANQYKEYLKNQKLDTPRLDPEPDKDGSFELWSYYHLGLPSFSLDFWTLPKPVKEDKAKDEITPEKLASMSNEDFLALGEEKIATFIKSAGMPPQFKADQLINALKSGQMNTKRMSEMLAKMGKKEKTNEEADPGLEALLAFSDKELQGKGFVPWKAFKHPTLGELEIGGEVPFADNTPPANMVENLLKIQVPWVLKISEKIARLKIIGHKVKSLGNGIYDLKVTVENTGYLPYPTAMGLKNTRITPAVLSLDGQEITILKGKKRELIKNLKGHQSQEISWLIQTGQPQTLKVNLSTPMAWGDQEMVQLGGGQ